jgi:hypothetical protein
MPRKRGANTSTSPRACSRESNQHGRLPRSGLPPGRRARRRHGAGAAHHQPPRPARPRLGQVRPDRRALRCRRDRHPLRRDRGRHAPSWAFSRSQPPRAPRSPSPPRGQTRRPACRPSTTFSPTGSARTSRVQPPESALHCHPAAKHIKTSLYLDCLSGGSLVETAPIHPELVQREAIMAQDYIVKDIGLAELGPQGNLHRRDRDAGPHGRARGIRPEAAAEGRPHRRLACT